MHPLGRFTRIGQAPAAKSADASVAASAPAAPCAPPSALAGRFAARAPAAPEAEAGGAEDAATARPGPAAERFRRGPSTANIPLAVENPEHQTFVRCVHCHSDNHADAMECQQCRAAFDTDDQRRFNRDLWKDERDRLRESRARREQARQDQTTQWEAEIERKRAEQTAREAAWAEDESRPGLFRNSRPSLGLQILRSIPDPRIRMAVLLSLVGLLAYTATRPDMSGTAWMLAFGLALLFLPRPKPTRR